MTDPIPTHNRSVPQPVHYMDLTSSTLPRMDEPRSWLAEVQAFIGHLGTLDKWRQLEHLEAEIRNEVAATRRVSLDCCLALLKIELIKLHHEVQVARDAGQDLAPATRARMNLVNTFNGGDAWNKQ